MYYGTNITKDVYRFLFVFAAFVFSIAFLIGFVVGKACAESTVIIPVYSDRSTLIGFDGICPVCKACGLRSKVYEQGCRSTLIAPIAHYDENGKYHYENPNITTCNYECSYGHKFSVSYFSGGETVHINWPTTGPEGEPVK
jgi:hypothetical protein